MEPPQEQGFWRAEVLKDLVFDNNRELLDHLRIEAMKAGFDIAARQSLVVPYGTFYCTKGRRVRSGRTSKTGCMFQFESMLVDDKIKIKIDETMELEHNHKLLPQVYTHRTLGTMARLRMNWEVIPITAVDQHRQLVSCGIMYASVTNEEVLTWLLEEIWRIVGDLGILRYIVTDEDAAFAAAFRQMVLGLNAGDEHEVIHHILCAVHNHKNFSNKLLKCGLTKIQRERVDTLFRHICYHTNNEYAQHCLRELRNMNQRVANYLDKHVVPVLPQFAKSFMDGVHANGLI